MQELKSILVRCNECKSSFPAPFFAPDVRSFQTLISGKVFATCPGCKTVIACNSSNTSYKLKDGTPQTHWPQGG